MQTIHTILFRRRVLSLDYITFIWQTLLSKGTYRKSISWS
uniref:Uncharacterized protein n=1 Tax=Anguilla anguilla TaxID=7936 RepID=A0A0E9R8L2_ANGAN